MDAHVRHMVAPIRACYRTQVGKAWQTIKAGGGPASGNSTMWGSYARPIGPDVNQMFSPYQSLKILDHDDAKAGDVRG